MVKFLMKKEIIFYLGIQNHRNGFLLKVLKKQIFHKVTEDDYSNKSGSCLTILL